jgi:hypothetical protein
MFGSMGRFNAMRATASKAGKPIAVSEKKMRELFIASGLSEDQVRLQMTVSKVMGDGGSCLIGDKLYTLKSSKKGKKNAKDQKRRI